MCQSNGATIFMGYLTVWKVLLQWWCRQQDIIVGVPAGHRAYPQLANTVGCLVNSLAIRTRMTSDALFSDILGSVRATALEAYANQEVPFDQVVQALGHVRGKEKLAPVYRAWFVLHDVPVPDWNLAEVRAELLDAYFLLSVHDIKLSLVVKDAAMEGGLDFRTSLFRRTTIQQLAKCLVELVQIVAHTPDKALPELNRAMQDAWNRTKAEAVESDSGRRLWNDVRTRRVPVRQE
jgi:non-ribosomal peptide synthetase component F